MKIFVQSKLWNLSDFLDFSLNERVYYGEGLKHIVVYMPNFSL